MNIVHTPERKEYTVIIKNTSLEMIINTQNRKEYVVIVREE